MTSKPTIKVIGSLNIDFVTLTPRVPGPGETLTATSLSVNAGGKGANQAVACGKAAFVSETEQDVTVEMIGAVGAGDPYYASLLQPTLEKSGVSTNGVSQLENVQTGTATIIVDEGSNGENRILFVPGANHVGNKDASKLIQVATTPQNPEVVVMQGEIPRGTVLSLLKHFNNSSIPTQVVFNPAPVYPEGIPLDCLKGLSVLVVNETECLQLGRSIDGITQMAAQVNEDALTRPELEKIAAKFHEVAGVKNVLITLGAAGSFYSSENGQQDLIPSVKVDKIVDTTAAGDTFVGFFTAALARHIASGSTTGFDVASAVKRANSAAAICVQRSGAMQSIPFGYE